MEQEKIQQTPAKRRSVKTFLYKCITGRATSVVLLSLLTVLGILMAVWFGRAMLNTRTGDVTYVVAPDLSQGADKTPSAEPQTFVLDVPEAMQWDTGVVLEIMKTKLPVMDAVPVTVHVDRQTVSLQVSSGTTVQGVLELIGMPLPETAEVDPQLSAQVDGQDKIVVRRVSQSVYCEPEAIPASVVYHETTLLKPGQVRRQSEGKDGVRLSVYYGTYVDGELVDSEWRQSQIVQQPVDAVYLIGAETEGPASPITQAMQQRLEAPLQLDANGQPLEYQQLLTGSVTAYTSAPGGLTCTGDLAQVGIVAVDTDYIPLGTLLYIVSPTGGYTYGYAIAGDIGAPSSTFLVDLFYDTEEECTLFGRRTMNVYVIG